MWPSLAAALAFGALAALCLSSVAARRTPQPAPVPLPAPETASVHAAADPDADHDDDGTDDDAPLPRPGLTPDDLRGGNAGYGPFDRRWLGGWLGLQPWLG